MTTLNRRRLLFVAPLLILLLAASIAAISAGVADLYAYFPRQHLEHWQNTGKSPSETQLTQALGNIETARRWQPDNAEYNDMQALLLYYQAVTQYQRQDQSGFTATTRQAIDHYRQATLKRPNWPYSWANLALMKAAIQQFDQEYLHALQRATELGPWENAVNTSVAEAGLLGWPHLDQTTQMAVIKNIERGIKRNKKALKQRLGAINKLTIACINLQASIDRKQFCGF